MTVKQRLMLVRLGVDVESILDSFCNNDEAYINCLKKFINDQSYNRMLQGIEKSNATEAFEGAHSLKGISGNMGFAELYNETATITEVFRTGNLDYEVDNLDKLKQAYERVIETINTL